MSQPQTICILEIFKDFFGCKNVLVATHQNSQNNQRPFRLQNCLSRKSSISWKISKTFSPAKLSSPQVIDILEIFKELWACKNFLAATHHYSEKIQRLYRLQICLSRKTSISWKYSKIFSPANLSQPQIIDILEIIKDFFACKIVVPATHQFINILKMFKNFFACKIVVAANQRYPGNIQRLFCLQKCLSRKPSVSWKYSKTFSAAKKSQQQPIKILKIFKDSFACKNVLAANHLYPGKIQRLFRLQSCPRRKSSISWKYSKTFWPAKNSYQQPIIILKKFKDFFACKIVLAANHRYPGNIQRLFRLRKCLSSNPSKFSKYSKTFWPAKNSYQQPIIILKKFKDFFACKIVLAAKHLYPGKIQRLFRLQGCLGRKSAISWKHSKIFPPAKLSQQQPINILKIFKDFLPAKMSQPQAICILEIFKDFIACKVVLAATHHNSEKVQKLFRLQNCLGRKSAISWKHSKIFPPAKLSQQQPINILKSFKDFFACKNVLAANHLYPGNIQRLFRLQKCISSNPSKFSK